MPEPVGIAVIGLDHWYTAFMVLDQIIGDDSMRLVGIAEGNARRLEETRQKYSPEIATNEYQQLLDREDVEIVFCFVPTADNPVICLQALGRGKHTLCVKPPAMTVQMANQLAAAAEDSGVIFSSTEVLPRLTSRANFIKDILQDGIIGQPVSFHHVAHSGLPQPWEGQTGDSWWLDPGKVPGGAWMDHAIYAIDQIRWTLEREVESVSGTTANRRHSGLKLEDYGVGWLRLDGGFTAVMEDTWTGDSGTRYDRWVGTDGSFSPEGDEIVVMKKGEVQRHPIPVQAAAPVAQIAAAARNPSKLPVTHLCSVRNLAACLAFYESARTGGTVTPEH